LNLKSFVVRSSIALVFGPLIVLFAILGNLYWLGFVLLVVVLSTVEYFKLAKHKDSHAHVFFGCLISFLIVVSFYIYSEYAVLPILIIGLLIVSLSELYRKNPSPFLNVSTGFYGSVYYALMFGSFILIREMPSRYGMPTDIAGKWIVMMLLATWLCDTAAYLYGSFFGKHKLMPKTSPNKTIEGTLAGFIAAVLSAWGCHVLFIQGLELKDSLIIGAIVGIWGQYGDLFESMLKRNVGVKDSSDLIPGHGGILDRFDSLTVAAPLVYLYLRSIFIYPV
jgi:phosphatidate cytidylyltransferase